MENKLKPCPFCGEDSAHIPIIGSNYFVRCIFCGASTRIFYDEAEAISAWNRREK